MPPWLRGLSSHHGRQIDAPAAKSQKILKSKGVGVMINKIRGFFKDRSGASAVEYGLLIGLIAVTLSLGAGALGSSVSTALAKPLDALSGAVPAGDVPVSVAPALPAEPVAPVTPVKGGPVKRPPVASPMG
jgi:Flp pilus assembly pilin Flp